MPNPNHDDHGRFAAGDSAGGGASAAHAHVPSEAAVLELARIERAAHARVEEKMRAGQHGEAFRGLSGR